MNFSYQKNGYNISEVNEYLTQLKESYENKISILGNQIDLLTEKYNQLYTKKDSISNALIAAIEKAKQIEESSKNMYKLKIQQTNLLCNKGNRLLEELVKKYPKIEEISSIGNMVENFKTAIKAALVEDVGLSDNVINTDNDPIRILLQRINNYNKNNQKIQKKESIIIERNKNEKILTSIRQEEKILNLKPIFNVQIQKNNKYETLAEQFLENDEEISGAYAQKFKKHKKGETDLFDFPEPNESGFDLKEAINPKDELEEIMKAFNFYSESE